MLTKLTTAFGLALLTGSLAFAADGPTATPQQGSTAPAGTQAPADTQSKQAAPAKGKRKHKRHHKKGTTSNGAPNSSSTPSTQ